MQLITQLCLGIILLAVAVMNAAIEFYQEHKSMAILDSFLNMAPSKTMAIREGRLHSVVAADLVVGDLVFVKSGDKVPADLRLVYANELKAPPF